MSHNQSRADKSDAQLRKPGRSGGASGQQRGFSGGGGGKGGGGFAPPVPASSPSSSAPYNAANQPSYSSSRSFKKSGNGQGGQPRPQPTPVSSQVSVAASAPSVRAAQNGTPNHPHMHGASNAPAPSGPKSVDMPAPKASPAVPRPPPSQSSAGLPDSTASAKGETLKSFTLQFGSITPGFVNGMQIPARTSSAPPNLDEQKRAQAARDSLQAASAITIPTSTAPKQPHQVPRKDLTGLNQPYAGDSHLPPPVKKDQVPVPIAMATQKSSAAPTTAMSMHMFQQPQIPLQSGGPGPQMQSQNVTGGSLPMPITHQMFVPAGLQSHIVHQGQGLSYATHMGHQVVPSLGSMGIGISTQYPQHQAGKFGGSRKTPVKITHPDTHEVLRLDKWPDSYMETPGQRSHLPPQSQPPSYQINFFQNMQNPYAPGLYYQAQSSLPVSSTQVNVSQSSRFNFPVGQSGPPVSIVNPSTLTTVSVSKPGHPMQNISELGAHALPVSVASAAVQVAVKPAATISTDKVGTVPVTSGIPILKDDGTKIFNPLHESSSIQQQKIAEAGLGSSVRQLNSSSEPSSINCTPAATLLPQKTESDVSISTPPAHVDFGSGSPHTDNRKKEYVRRSDSFKDIQKTDQKVSAQQLHKKVDQKVSEQQLMADTSESTSSSNLCTTEVHQEITVSNLSDKQVSGNLEQTSTCSQENPTLVDVCFPLPMVEHHISEIKNEVASTVSSDSSSVSKLEDPLQDVPVGSLSATVTTDVMLPSEPTTTEVLHAPALSQAGNSFLDVEPKQYFTEPGKPEISDDSSVDSSNAKVHPVSSVTEPSYEVEQSIVSTGVASETVDAEANQKCVIEEEKVCSSNINSSMEEAIEANNKSVNCTPEYDTFSHLPVIEIKPSTEDVVISKSGSLSDLEVSSGESFRLPETEPVSESDSSDTAHKHERKTSDIGGPFSRSLSSLKERTSSEVSRTKITTGKKKKKKEILLRADAAGTNSDLYMAYKGPEEHAAIITSENIDNSSTVDNNLIKSDEVKEVKAVKEDGHSKSDVDDWEDVVEISSPRLKTTEKLGKGHGSKKHFESGSGANIKKKYSRDFLLTFSEQCTDLPTEFEIGPDAAALMSVQGGMSRLANHDPLSGHARIIDRPSSGNRGDRRVVNAMDDDRWAKSNSFPSVRDVGHGAGVGFRAGQGASHGVLRNPRVQNIPYAGGILSGPIQSPGAQGIPRSNVDADRWQRGSNIQRGLIPSPQTPATVMHKAEKRYEIGKVSDQEEAKQRQLKGILNKLTPQNFERLFEQVKEVNIDNTVTLTGVISQIFDKALMEPTFCEMYANFCLHLAGELPDFNEDNEKVTFKRLLLNKCQEEFERNEREQDEANKAEEEGEVKQSEEQREEKRLQARRRMLGNIRLIGELYKKKMLTERIMHECIKKLLGQYQNPDEEDIEALCKLMSTIGAIIDHPKAKEHMDAYFDMMKKLSTNQKLSSRVRFMLRDAIDLRKNKWQQRRKIEGPKKIEDVHRDAAQERQAQASRSARGSSSARRGPPPVDYGPRGSTLLPFPGSLQIGAIRNVPPQNRGHGAQDVRMEDRHSYESRTLSVPLTQRPTDDSITLGPQGGLARGMSLRGQPLMPNPPSAESRPRTAETQRATSGPNGYSYVHDQSSSQDRSQYLGDRASDRPFSSSRSADQVPGSSAEVNSASSVATALSEEQLQGKSLSAIREYYSAKDEEEVARCMKELNSPSFYPSMVSLWVIDSFERKDMERNLLSKLLVYLCKSGDHLLSCEQLIKGFESVLLSLEDVVNDAPRAAEFLGRIFVKTVLANFISFGEIGRLILEGGEEPGRLVEIGLAADVLGSILEIIKAEEGDAVLNEIRSSSNLRLEDFRPPNPTKSKKFEQFL